MIALTDMRANLFAAIVLLLVGAMVLRRVRRSNAHSSSSRWVPIACLLAGPLIAGGWLIADALVFREEYVVWSDYWETGWRVMAIGLLGGLAGAIVLWTAVGIPQDRRS